MTVHVDGNVYEVAWVYINVILSSVPGVLLLVGLPVGLGVWLGWPTGLVTGLVAVVAVVGLTGLALAVYHRHARAPAGWGGGLAVTADTDGLRVDPQGATPPSPTAWTWDQVVKQRRAFGHRILVTQDGSAVILPRRRLRGTPAGRLIDERLGG